MPDQEKHNGFVPEVWFHAPVWSRKVVAHERVNASIMQVLTRLEAETQSITRSNVGGGSEVTFVGVAAATLHQDDFVFV